MGEPEPNAGQGEGVLRIKSCPRECSVFAVAFALLCPQDVSGDK